MYLYLQIKPFHIYTYIYDPTPFHLTYDTLQQTGKCLSVDSTGRRRMVRDTPLMTSIHATNESEGLRGYMGQFGEIDSSTIMRDPSGRSRGFAFLTYSNVSSVDKVMGQVHHLDGKQASWVWSRKPQLTIRSTPNEPFLEPSTKRPPRSSSEV